jgi:hypothetical protein
MPVSWVIHIIAVQIILDPLFLPAQVVARGHVHQGTVATAQVRAARFTEELFYLL